MPASGNVGIAFALVCGAGLCTTLGASCAFFAKLAAPRFLAAGLGLSAGVMLYVSFVEIFMTKGVSALSLEWGDTKGYRNGTLLFLGGMAITAILDQIVQCITLNIEDVPGGTVTAGQPKIQSAGVNTVPDCESQCVTVEDAHGQPRPDPKAAEPPRVCELSDSEGNDDSEDSSSGSMHLANVPADIPPATAALVDKYISADEHRFALKKMGVLTALAIGIHNLPEGLATFVATLADPTNGVAIAVAIALHNIPEGVCVAMPIYYATGSRWKGFIWAFISGLSEPVGGLLGWLVLYGNRMSNLSYGLLFTIVAGMMTYISIKELIPTALKYDPHDKVVSTCVIVGMVVMAASLLMFTIE